MTKPVIQFESVSKKFRQRRGRSLRDFFLRLGQSGQPSSAPQPFWALKDVSFSIQPGETVGLIGPNGAGKSTILKLMSGVSLPTSGNIKVRGRIGALLELGAGFHPELSGRENVYLSAALMGMSRTAIKRKFDAIVDFSEIATFIDEPVKHYSSGMFMRLAFAVNIHVEPDLLLVDEVLAVGDASFQQKCLERIIRLRENGTTIFLVTHTLGTVRAMCSRALWIEKGQVRMDGLAEAVALGYLGKTTSGSLESQVTGTPNKHETTVPIWITKVETVDENFHPRRSYHTGQTMIVKISYAISEKVHAPIFGLAIHRADGVHISGPNTRFNGFTIPTLTQAGIVSYTIPSLCLLEGVYKLTIAIVNYNDTTIFDFHDQAYTFHVINNSLPTFEQYGLVTLNGNWSIGFNRISEIQ